MAFTTMYQASIDAGKLAYNASSASSCIAAMRDVTCTEFAVDDDALESRCPNPFEGQVANGMQCAFDEECQSGYCEGDSQGNNPMSGTCKPLPTQGQACIDFECADNLQCDAGTCSPLKADGEECFDGEECMSGGCNGATNNAPGMCGAAMLCDGQ